MKKTILLGLATTALLTGCSNDELTTLRSIDDSNAIGFTSFVNKSTRATDLTNSNIGTNNGFAVYGYTDTGTDGAYEQIFDNESVTGSNSGSSGDYHYTNQQYWQAGYAYRFHAIAPYGLADGDAVAALATKQAQAEVDKITYSNDSENTQKNADLAKYKALYATADSMTWLRHWKVNTSTVKPELAKIEFTNIDYKLTDKSQKYAFAANGDQDLVYSFRSVESALATNNDKVQLEFAHLLSRVNFKFIGTDKNPASVKIYVDSLVLTNTYDKGEITITNLNTSNEVIEASSIYADNSSANSTITEDWKFENLGGGLDGTSGESATGSEAAKKVELTYGSQSDSFTTGNLTSNHKYVIPVNESTKYGARIVFRLVAHVGDKNSKLEHTYTVTKTIAELPEVTMKKGYSYTYQIGVDTSDDPSSNNIIDPILFNVKVVEDWAAWEDEDKVEADPDTSDIIIKDATNVKVGDIALNDGTFLRLHANTWDLINYSKPSTYDTSDQTVKDAVDAKLKEKEAKLADLKTIWGENKANVVGVVYYLLGDNEYIKGFSSATQHGLIVSTKDVTSTVAWQNAALDVAYWVSSQPKTIDDPNDSTNASGSKNQITNPLYYLTGYDAVTSLTSFNTITNAEIFTKFNAVEANSSYAVNSVLTTVQSFSELSGWYVPSYLSASKLMGQLNTDAINYFAPFTNDQSYWTSTEEAVSYSETPTSANTAKAYKFSVAAGEGSTQTGTLATETKTEALYIRLVKPF
jgi:hypothetical protein